MLPGEANHPRKIFASDGQVVNRLLTVLCEPCDSTLARGFTVIVKAVQERWFDDRSLLMRCPDCGGSHVIGKGWRSRVLRASSGRIELSVRFSAKVIKGRFAHLTRPWGLPPADAFSMSLLTKRSCLGSACPLPIRLWL